MNILITGVAGFVGSSLARTILREVPQAAITGLDNLSFGYIERLDDIRDRMTFVEADLADVSRVLSTQRFDLIVHCAAIAPLPECQIDSHRALVQNVANCGAVADFASRSGSRDIVFFSSGAIYEGVTQFPTPEDVAIAPRLVYPTSKFLAEQYFQAMCRSHALNVTAIRLFNLYGPHQDYFRKQPPLIGYLLTNLIRDTEATLFSTGEQCRDYVYIDDLLDLVRKAGANMNALQDGGHFRAVNAGSGIPVSVNTMIATLEGLAGRKLRIDRQPSGKYWDRYGELFERAIPLDRSIIEQEVEKHTHASTAYAQREFGWATSVSIEQGLQACLDHARNILGTSKA
jgi:UDP-glucose 4-epimerase